VVCVVVGVVYIGVDVVDAVNVDICGNAVGVVYYACAAVCVVAVGDCDVGGVICCCSIVDYTSAVAVCIGVDDVGVWSRGCRDGCSYVCCGGCDAVNVVYDVGVDIVAIRVGYVDVGVCGCENVAFVVVLYVGVAVIIAGTCFADVGVVVGIMMICIYCVYDMFVCTGVRCCCVDVLDVVCCWC